MALTGYSRRHSITIDSSYIPTTILNCPIVLTAEAFDSGLLNNLKTDASDLRFTSDSEGLNELAREIQHFDQLAGEIIVHVKIDSFIASTSKTIYAWGSNSDAIEPSPRSDSGAQSVWNGVFGTIGVDAVSYYGVVHCQLSPNSGTLFTSDTGFKSGFESTGNWTAINNDGNIAQGLGTGFLPGQNVWELDATGGNITNLEAINTQSADSTVAHYFEFWHKFNATPSSNNPIFVGDFNRFLKFESNGKLKFGDSGNASTANVTDTNFHQRIMRRSAGGSVNFHLDGASDGTTSTTQDLENMNRIFQDRNSNGGSNMDLFWLRIFRGVDPGSDHVQVQWNSVNEYNSATKFANAGALTTISASVPVKVTALDLDGSLLEDASILLEAETGGSLPSGASVTITRSGTTATVTHTAHGLSNGDQVVIRGSNEFEYTGVHTISNVTANTYDFTVSGSPATPATGTVTSTYIIIVGTTDVNGEIENATFPYTSDQPVKGWVRKNSSAPRFKQSQISATITSTGLDLNVLMISDD